MLKWNEMKIFRDQYNEWPTRNKQREPNETSLYDWLEHARRAKRAKSTGGQCERLLLTPYQEAKMDALDINWDGALD